MLQYHEIKRAHPRLPVVFSGWAISTSCSSRTRSPPRRRSTFALTKRGRPQRRRHPDVRRTGAHRGSLPARLIRAGFKVAICDQDEDPPRRAGAATRARCEARGGARRHRRHLTEDGLLDARRHNYLAGIAEAGGEMGSPGSICRPARLR
jgi:DNA mismatch repair protein MutS